MPNKDWTTGVEPKPLPNWTSQESEQPLKSLDDIGKEHSTGAVYDANRAPKPEAPLPEPVENIDENAIIKSLGKAAKKILDATVDIKRAEVDIPGASFGLREDGPKGSSILLKMNEFRDKIKSLYTELETLSDTMGQYKPQLPSNQTEQSEE
jgi:hypothetical protein